MSRHRSHPSRSTPRRFAAAAAAAVVALAAGACATTSSDTGPLPDDMVELSSTDADHIRMLAVREFRHDAQQIMCIGVMAAAEIRSGGFAVDAPDIFLRLLGDRTQFRPYSACTSGASVGAGRPGITTVADRRTATIVVLYRPYGFAGDRARVIVTERSMARGGTYRCELRKGTNGAWEVTACPRYSG